MLTKGYAAWFLGAIFGVVGIVYLLLNTGTSGFDPAGATMLIILGIAMTFAFLIILRGSREL
ncbi:MAG: hypothetical protein XU10_C0003G0123 [Chloroflexi bacterium CSP1-4]|nr:MAG: hypothetical protein XU10_C0003G0123 [Chloroflexi bacterium CSP1-4]